MKIEIKEKFIKITPDEGRLLYRKAKPSSLMKEIYLPKKFTEEQIHELYSEISSCLFDKIEQEGQEPETDKEILNMRFSKLAVKGKLKGVNLSSYTNNILDSIISDKDIAEKIKEKALSIAEVYNN